MKIKIIGLTGPTGSGKSALKSVFEEYNCELIDCDMLSRKAVEPNKPALNKLAEAFGGDIIRADGTLDRALLASRAFPTPEGREKLNSIVHPAVKRLLRARFAACERRGRNAAVDAPLLFEAGLESVCDAVIVVVASDELRLKRITERDGLTKKAAMTRMKAQHPCEYYSSRADYTIVNDGDMESFFKSARTVLDSIIGKGDAN